MSKLDPRIESVRAKYDLDVNDFWKIKQNGQWVCKHAALEIVAVKAGIEWLPPQILEADAPNLVTSMIVTGKMGERVEWATGETNKTNYSIVGKQPAYPWAMSEKRAKDRVVLKLVGIHGLVYSEDEMPAEEARTTDQRSEQDRREVDAQKPQSVVSDERAEAVKSLWAELANIKSAGGLKSFWMDNYKIIKSIGPETEKKFTEKKDELKAKFDQPVDTVKAIQEQFPGARVVREEDITSPGDEDFPGNTNIKNGAGRTLHTMEGL